MKHPHEWTQLPRSGSKLITSEVVLNETWTELLIPRFAEKIVSPKMAGVDNFPVLIFNRKSYFGVYCFWISNFVGNYFPTSILDSSFQQRSVCLALECWAEMN